MSVIVELDEKELEELCACSCGCGSGNNSSGAGQGAAEM